MYQSGGVKRVEKIYWRGCRGSLKVLKSSIGSLKVLESSRGSKKVLEGSRRSLKEFSV